MGHPREYRADKTNEPLEWIVLDAHVFVIIFCNLRNSFCFWNETILYCPSNSSVSSPMKDKHTTILNSLISWITKNEWMNEWTPATKGLFLWDYKALMKCLTVLSVKMMFNLSLVWDEENKSEKQTGSKWETQNLEIRYAAIKSKALRLFFIYLHVAGEKSIKLQSSLLPQSQVITFTVALNWEVSISSCLSPQAIPSCLLFQAVLRTS